MSPGRAITTSSTYQPIHCSSAGQLYVLDLVSGERTNSDLTHAYPDWSPDGGQIAYFEYEYPFRIWVIDPLTGDGEPVLEGGHFAWFPDGASLVHDREVKLGDVDIYVDDDLLVDGPGVDTLSAVSPDGSSVVFSSDRP